MIRYNKLSLTRFAATVCKAMGIAPPVCAEPPVDWIADALDDFCKEGFDRVLIHNPDAGVCGSTRAIRMPLSRCSSTPS